MDHLQPEFNPNKSVVAHLRNILLRHDVPWPANAKKPQLVALYESHVRPKAPVLLRESLGVKASDHGILDGESQDGASLGELCTGSDRSDFDHHDARPMSTASGLKQDARSKKRAFPAANASGRVPTPKRKKDSAADTDERERNHPTKSPTHNPGLGQPPASSAGDDATKMKSQSASRHASAAGARRRTTHLINPSSSPLAPTSTPRRSLNYDSSGEAGFSDYNPFQSGPEDTPERKPRRKSSLGPGKSCVVDMNNIAYAESLPCGDNHLASNSSPPALHRPRLTAGSVESRHQLPSGTAERSSGHVTLPGRRYVVRRESIKYTPDEIFVLGNELEALDRREQVPDCDETGSSSQEPEDDTPTQAYAGSLSSVFEPEGEVVDAWSSPPGAPTDSVCRRFTAPPVPNSALATVGPLPARNKAEDRTTSPRAFTVLCSLVLLAFTLWWREEKLMVGFCDTQTAQNALSSSRSDSLFLRSFAPRWSSAWLTKIPSDFWRQMDRTHLRPSCSACPSHGVCDGGQFLGCQPDHIIRPHPFRLRGLVPLASRCAPDSDKLMLIALRASRLAARLRVHRGDVICTGSTGHVVDKALEVHVYGVSAEQIARWAKEDNNLSASPLDEKHLEDLNELALRDLQDHGEVLGLVDRCTRDEMWYAATSADMPIGCKLRLAAWRQAREHTVLFITLLAMVATWLYGRLAWTRHVQEASRVRRLVQSALVLLRKQAEQSRSGAAITPEPAIAQSHLRDLILQEEHSPAKRDRLWTQVARVVEGNANIRAKEVEFAGEELRAWEWTGKIDRTDAIEEMMERKSLKRLS
ncbi:BQ5605_C003g02026 [Microbotryum silenes-dioicae]|uniref:BQ5605_C003g02026 protein n=1 Tax=Microbotryum silenes-dioicae TaxID=796604 RepID=A0A2X0NXT9_9BASI|nr:BQ5605_C003g02026 [Microbotryum silenes-dioicae]